MAMDRATGIFVDGIGTAAATSGVLSPLGGRIFGLLYLHERPLALDEIATALEQSKSNISVNIRGLVEWHLVRRVPVAGSRKDHYEAATNFWRVFQEIRARPDGALARLRRHAHRPRDLPRARRARLAARRTRLPRPLLAHRRRVLLGARPLLHAAPVRRTAGTGPRRGACAPVDPDGGRRRGGRADRRIAGRLPPLAAGALPQNGGSAPRPRARDPAR